MELNRNVDLLLFLTISKLWPSKLSDHFKISVGFERAWPFQNLSGYGIVELFTMGILLDKVSNF